MGLNKTNKEKAVLDMIAYAEGTLGVSKNGYDVVFNYFRIPNWDYNFTLGHQDKEWEQRSNGFTSTASGRYQFLGSTWKEFSKSVLKLNNAPFNKRNQDDFAIILVKSKNKTITYSDGTTIPKPPDISDINESNFKQFLDSISPTWASIPCSLKNGFGFYSNQKGRYNAKQLYKIYNLALQKYNNS